MNADRHALMAVLEFSESQARTIEEQGRIIGQQNEDNSYLRRQLHEVRQALERGPHMTPAYQGEAQQPRSARPDNDNF